jgi:hypothetical protein
MSSFFSIYTHTPWDGLKTDQLTQIKLLSLNTIFKTFPVIEQAFFDDLSSKIKSQSHYSMIKAIKRIMGPNNEDYNITNFHFIWAYDKKNRMYQLLFQHIKSTDKHHGILVALAPPELGKLFLEYKKEALHRILTLLTRSEDINFLLLLTAEGKSIVEESQPFSLDKETLEKIDLIRKLKLIPNTEGRWFPSFAPRCPICNAFLNEIKDYRVSFGKLICSKCGYEREK